MDRCNRNHNKNNGFAGFKVPSIESPKNLRRVNGWPPQRTAAFEKPSGLRLLRTTKDTEGTWVVNHTSSSSQPHNHPPIYRPHHSISSPFSPYHHLQPLFFSHHPHHHHLFFPPQTLFSNSTMGFPSVYYCVILPKPLILVVQLLDCIKLAVSTVLFCLGFASSPEDYYVYPLPATDFSVTSSLPITPSAIKSRIPVVKLSSFRRSAAKGEEYSTCAVCLGELEAMHEVRELGNCFHVFHKGCIDKWVDMGQITCPLCRAQLVPKGREEIKGMALLG